MRVMMVEPSGWGGIGLYTHLLTDALSSCGINVFLLTNTKRHDFADKKREYEVYRLLTGDKWFKYWRTIDRMASEHQVDVVHIQAPCATRKDWLAYWSLKILLRPYRVVLTAHNILPHEGERFGALTHRLSYRNVDGLIVHSNYSSERLHDLMGEWREPEVAVIHHGHYEELAASGSISRDDALKKLNLEDLRYLVLFGTVRPYKGADWLLQAVAQQKSWPDDLCLLIAGMPMGGVSEEEMIQLRTSLGLDERVVFRFEYFEDAVVPAIFSVADMMVLPYRAIDQSGILMAAMGAGLPVLATRVGAFEEYVTQQTGYLTDEVNVESLSASLTQALEDREQWQEKGQAGKQKAKDEYSWDSAADQTVLFYQKLLNE